MLSEWFHNAVKMVNDDIMVALDGFTIPVLAPNMNGFQDNWFFLRPSSPGREVRTLH